MQKASFQLGADLSFAAGPVGGGGSIGDMPNAQVLSYQHAAGLYAGATVNGFILSHMPQQNKKVYGDDITPPQILKTNGSKAPNILVDYMKTLNHYLPTK